MILWVVVVLIHLAQMACRAVESISLGGVISQEYDTTMVGASSGISVSDTVATNGNKNIQTAIIAVITFY